MGPNAPIDTPEPHIWADEFMAQVGMDPAAIHHANIMEWFDAAIEVGRRDALGEFAPSEADEPLELPEPPVEN